ncbi:MAG: response regulator, partial [Pseudomonadota bacterium]
LEHIKMTTDGRTEFIIIVDINMPRCNGFELLDLIRAHDAYRETPVIMLSVSDDESDIFEAFERGANGYVVKPFSSDEFFAALSNVPSVKQQIVQ